MTLRHTDEEIQQAIKEAEHMQFHSLPGVRWSEWTMNENRTRISLTVRFFMNDELVCSQTVGVRLSQYKQRLPHVFKRAYAKLWTSILGHLLFKLEELHKNGCEADKELFFNAPH